MNKLDLYKSFGELDPALLERSEKKASKRTAPWVKWGAVAAVAALAVGAAFAVPALTRGCEECYYVDNPGVSEPAPNPDPDSLPNRGDPQVDVPPTHLVPGAELDEPDEPIDPDAATSSPIVFNPIDESGPTSCPLVEDIEFEESLTEEETAALLPEGFPDWAVPTNARALYEVSGVLKQAQLDIVLPCGAPVRVTLVPNGTPFDYGASEPTVSRWGDREFYAWERSSDGWLLVEVPFDSILARFSAYAAPEQLEAVRSELGALAMPYAAWDGAPTLDDLSMKEDHVFQNDELSYADALADADFGAYLPSEGPEGFPNERFLRYKHDDLQDFLTGFWDDGGYNLFTWRVERFTEQDASRVTSVADLENYDLTLYPIPRAESVPEDKREIVDNPIFPIEELTLETVKLRAYAGDTPGVRMEFSVLVGDVVVEIHSMGASPEWVFEQLSALRG